MKPNRRSFLKALSATPLATKAVADKAVAELAGISSSNAAMMAPGYGVPIADSDNGKWKLKVLNFLARKTLPDWFDEEIRRRCQNVVYLDPDLAAKRSWSMSVKIATQRERNIERAKKEALDGPRRSLRSQEFSEQFGVYL